jgi:hypothetical protein
VKSLQVPINILNTIRLNGRSIQELFPVFFSARRLFSVSSVLLFPFHCIMFTDDTACDAIQLYTKATLHDSRSTMREEYDTTYLLWLKVATRKRKAKTMSGDEDDNRNYICRRNIIRTLIHFLVEISHVKMQSFMPFYCVIEGLSFSSSVTFSSSCSIPSIYTIISFFLQVYTKHSHPSRSGI